MSPTEKLRAMLDERGVELGANDTYRLFVTSWNDASGHSWTFMEHRDGSFSKLTAYHLTPEQAIAATLGTGTCHIEQTSHVKVAGVDYYDDDYECSECGDEMFKWYNYCPNCGAKVIDE